MAKKARKKTAVKRKTKSKVARNKKVAAKTKARAAAGKTKKKAAKKRARARKPKPQTIGERVSSAVKAVMDTFTEAEQMRKKIEPRGSDATE